MTCAHGGQGCAITHAPAAAALALRGRRRAREGRRSRAAATATRRIPRTCRARRSAARQRERVLAYIEKGKQEGARCLVGGGVPKHLPKGYYVEPTLFADVDPDSTLAQEEIFGPGARA